MKITRQIIEWLEVHWVSPSYSGCLLAGISLCFFGAATNTMAGWLYVISGMIFALLGLAAVIPTRSLRKLKVRRHPIAPVSVGDQLTIELEIENPTSKPQNLLQVRDLLPYVLAQPIQTPIELIPPHSIYRWVYYPTTQRRGVYRWHEVQLRTGTPLGLFWCRRSREVMARAIVYPTVLPLTSCPLVDTIGQEDSTRFQSDRRYQTATEGITRTLRPYRQGDSTRLIHWRTSARFGELQVRELEIVTGGQEIIICLDSAPGWDEEVFEEAVIAAASLYFYASRCQLNVKLWTPATGLLHSYRVVLEALAAIEAGEDTRGANLPSVPLIWLTQNLSNLDSLPHGSRWVLFPTVSSNESKPVINRNFPGLVINSEQPLERQLQRPIISH
ncbi:MAG: DUF58 domain-containing protein [Xenococcaceae cyanobacterium]